MLSYIIMSSKIPPAQGIIIVYVKVSHKRAFFCSKPPPPSAFLYATLEYPNSRPPSDVAPCFAFGLDLPWAISEISRLSTPIRPEAQISCRVCRKNLNKNAAEKSIIKLFVFRINNIKKYSVQYNFSRNLPCEEQIIY